MEYIINEEKGVVVAIMHDTENDALDFIYKNIPSFDWFHTDLNLRINNRYAGVAKCAPDDTFDVGKGKQIAKARARVKHDKDFCETITRATSLMRKQMEKSDEKATAKYLSGRMWLKESLK